MYKRMFPEIVENGNGSELIVEIDTDEFLGILHLLVPGIHTELVSLDSLMIEMGEYVVVGHHLDEVILTPLVVSSLLRTELALVVRIMVQLQLFRPVLHNLPVVQVTPERQMVQLIIQIHLVKILILQSIQYFLPLMVTYMEIPWNFAHFYKPMQVAPLVLINCFLHFLDAFLVVKV